MIFFVCLRNLALDLFKVRWGICSLVFPSRFAGPSSTSFSDNKRAHLLWSCKSPFLGSRRDFCAADFGWFLAYRGSVCIFVRLFFCLVFLVFSHIGSRAFSMGLCSSLVSAYVIPLCICNVRVTMFLFFLITSLFSLLFKTSYFLILILLEVLLILIALSLLKTGISAWWLLPLIGLGACERSLGLSISVWLSRSTTLSEYKI